MKSFIASVLIFFCFTQLTAASTVTTTELSSADSITLVFPDTSFTVSADSVFVNPTDSITHNGKFYVYQGKAVRGYEIIRIVKNEGAAHRVMVYSRICYWIGAPFAFVGGGLLTAWPIAAIATWSPQWMLGALGAGTIAVSIPFFLIAEKLMAKAVRLHNENVPSR